MNIVPSELKEFFPEEDLSVSLQFFQLGQRDYKKCTLQLFRTKTVISTASHTERNL